MVLHTKVKVIIVVCLQMKTIATIILLTIILSCNRTDKTQRASSIFTKPRIIQPYTEGIIGYIYIDYVSECYPRFAGKHKFTDTLFIPEKRYLDTTYHNDFIDPRVIWDEDSIRADGFELIPDYSSNVYRNDFENEYANYFYPVYIVNQTPTVKSFIGKDSRVFGLQEALDTNGYWRPIEGQGFDFCGNGYWRLKVHPQEFITVLFPKYSGNYKTKIRVRIENGENIYVSQPYDGTINEKQLYLKKESYLYNDLIENKSSAIQNLFYGATPFGAEDKDFGLYIVWSE